MNQFEREARAELDAIDIATGVLPPPIPPCEGHEPRPWEITRLGDASLRYLCLVCGYEWSGQDSP